MVRGLLYLYKMGRVDITWDILSRLSVLQDIFYIFFSLVTRVRGPVIKKNDKKYITCHNQNIKSEVKSIERK